VSAPVPSHSSSRASQARKDKKEKKEYLEQMSEMAKIVKQQRLENKKIQKLFQIPKDRLSNCLKLSVSNKRTLLLTRGKKLSQQR
jgi:predicted XRE-type DNA-binding protein